MANVVKSILQNYFCLAGGCDSFCQNARRLEAQSLNQFEKDLKNVEAHFASGQSNANFIPQNPVAGSPLFGQNHSYIGVYNKGSGKRLTSTLLPLAGPVLLLMLDSGERLRI